MWLLFYSTIMVQEYVGKMFNDDWMRERGFLEEEFKNAKELIQNHSDQPLVTLFGEELVSSRRC